MSGPGTSRIRFCTTGSALMLSRASQAARTFSGLRRMSTEMPLIPRRPEKRYSMPREAKPFFGEISPGTPIASSLLLRSKALVQNSWFSFTH